jgi:acetyltransferase-like isoleucine patch superfamily enzyme
VHRFSSTVPSTVAGLVRTGLLELGQGCLIHPTAVFVPSDMNGQTRPIKLEERVRVGAHAVIHGGAVIGRDAMIGHQVIVGEPEFGYAVRKVYMGAGCETVVGRGVLLRSGAVIYAGATIGNNTTIGHGTLLRSQVRVGSGSQLAANLTIERGATIGNDVRCSPGTHITADTTVGDRVFLGAGVRTVNDNILIWRDPEHEQPLSPPSFGYCCRIGSGAVILAGIDIGDHALVGAGSVVTHDVAAWTIAYGVPARPHGQVSR